MTVPRSRLFMTSPDGTDSELPEELWETLEDLYELATEDPEEARTTFASFPEEVRNLREFQMALAGIEKHLEHFEDAEKRLRALLERYPNDADLCHQLADLLEDSGELEEAGQLFLETLRLDRQKPKLTTDEIFARIDQAVRQILRELPPDYQKRLSHVPVIVEDRPTEDMVREGLDPRSLGVFEGDDHASDLNQEIKVSPTRIVLFAENLVDDAGDGPELEEEVGITVLHEIGHYFGLDEEDMERLGLD